MQKRDILLAHISLLLNIVNHSICSTKELIKLKLMLYFICAGNLPFPCSANFNNSNIICPFITFSYSLNIINC